MPHASPQVPSQGRRKVVSTGHRTHSASRRMQGPPLCPDITTAAHRREGASGWEANPAAPDPPRATGNTASSPPLRSTGPCLPWLSSPILSGALSTLKLSPTKRVVWSSSRSVTAVIIINLVITDDYEPALLQASEKQNHICSPQQPLEEGPSFSSIHRSGKQSTARSSDLAKVRELGRKSPQSAPGRARGPVDICWMSEWRGTGGCLRAPAPAPIHLAQCQELAPSPRPGSPSRSHGGRPGTCPVPCCWRPGGNNL